MEKRLFIGIKIEPSTKLLEVYEELKIQLKKEKIKWTAIENFHITLKFIGNADVEHITRINEIINKTAVQFRPFQFKINGIGAFSKNKHVKVIWMGIEENSELKSLANLLIKNLWELGFENEERAYTAHLTLGRVNSFVTNDMIEILLTKYKDQFIQNVEVNEVILFESVLTKNGTKYFIIEKYPLQNNYI